MLRNQRFRRLLTTLFWFLFVFLFGYTVYAVSIVAQFFFQQYSL